MIVSGVCRNKMKKKSKFFGLSKGLGDILRPYCWRILLLSLLMILQSVLQVALALFIRWVIDAALSQSDTLGLWALALVADLLLQVAVYAFLAWYAGSTVDRFSTALRSKLMRSAVYSADSQLQGFHSGQLLSRGMEDVHTVCDGAINALPSLVGQITQLVAAFGAVLLIYPRLSGVLLVAAAVVVAGVTALRPALKRRQLAVREAEEKVMSTMQEDLQRLELIQSLNAREQILKRFDKWLGISLRKKDKRRLLHVGSTSILGAGSLLGTGALLLWGAFQVASGVLSYGSLTAMLQLLGQFRGPVLSLSGLWTRFAAIEVAGERLAVLLEVPQEETAPETAMQVTAVVFENVTFCYPGEETAVVENFSKRFPLEGWTCLTGISGRGKTTLFKLILGLYKPQNGRVYLETDRGEIPCSEATRRVFAYVPQDYALFSGTVRDNLLLAAPEADEDRRRFALNTAQARFLWDMPAGEETPVGENNTGLSKGQLQRIAIARAVLMERPVFLLDECTSALDADTEKAVLRGLQTLGKKALVVTHHPDALDALEDIHGVSLEE